VTHTAQPAVPAVCARPPPASGPFRLVRSCGTDTGVGPRPSFKPLPSFPHDLRSPPRSYVTGRAGSIVWLSDILLTEPCSAAQVAACGLPPSPLLTLALASRAASRLLQVLQAHPASAVFVSFDIDSISGADCPGVSCPATVGLSAQVCVKGGGWPPWPGGVAPAASRVAAAPRSALFTPTVWCCACASELQDAVSICYLAGLHPQVRLVDVSELNPGVEDYRCVVALTPPPPTHSSGTPTPSSLPPRHPPPTSVGRC
jgi:hypothetical protein